MMRGVQLVCIWGGRLELEAVCDDDGCDLSIGSSQSTPVYSALSFPVPIPVEPSPTSSLVV